MSSNYIQIPYLMEYSTTDSAKYAVDNGVAIGEYSLSSITYTKYVCMTKYPFTSTYQPEVRFFCYDGNYYFSVIAQSHAVGRTLHSGVVYIDRYGNRQYNSGTQGNSSFPNRDSSTGIITTTRGLIISYMEAANWSTSNITTFYVKEDFTSFQEAVNTVWDGVSDEYPITYIPINSTLSGPETASSGDTVSVDVSFPDGYIYRETGISVYDTNGVIAHSYDPATGKLTFTMP